TLHLRGNRCTDVHSNRKSRVPELRQWSRSMDLKMRSLTRWSAAPAKDVETAVSPKFNVLRGLAARATPPLLPEDDLKLLSPVWAARELRGVVVEAHKETEGSATVPIKPGWGFSGDYQPGQYLG